MEFETYHVAFVHRKVAVPLNLCIHVLAKHPFLIQLNEFLNKKKQKKSRKRNKQIELDKVKKIVWSHMLPADKVRSGQNAVGKWIFLRYIIFFVTAIVLDNVAVAALLSSDILLVFSSLILNYLIDTFIKWLCNRN